MTVYRNVPVDRVSGKGGAVRVVIASNIGQGNGGTTLPCREVFVAQGMTETSPKGPVMMNIGAAATSILGVIIPGPPATATITLLVSSACQPMPMRLAIDDVSKLYFWSGTDGDAVDILYRQ